MTQLLFFLAGAAYLAQLALFARLHLRGGRDPVSEAVSDYGVGPSRRLFALYGAAGIAAAAVLAGALLADGRFPAQGWLYLLAMAALRLGVLAFPTDLEGERLTRSGKAHYLFAVASFALAYMAVDALSPSAASLAAAWARPVLNGLGWVVAASLAGVVICLIPALRRIFGLVERIFLLSVLLWLGIFAFAMAG
ncbi:DUF998 domain-containing protein [Neomegalonema perideroedes]|uniref:DUF998 domain-containing protein n=1 Tax=Neomegalonema perideroedes TaxID=217219 RepID=UPI0003651DF4|nr:DUF998 domain-containing protein [Neomegalonema perideroedes]